ADHARCDSLDRHCNLNDPDRLCHRCAPAQTARGSGELRRVGWLHPFLRGQRLETREILTRLERKEIQQPARHRHQCVLQIIRKVGRLRLTVKTRLIYDDRARRMASCISLTARSRPTKTDRLMMECPMFSSSISGIAATNPTFLTVSPWPACTASPSSAPLCAESRSARIGSFESG